MPSLNVHTKGCGMEMAQKHKDSSEDCEYICLEIVLSPF